MLFCLIHEELSAWVSYIRIELLTPLLLFHLWIGERQRGGHVEAETQLPVQGPGILYSVQEQIMLAWKYNDCRIVMIENSKFLKQIICMIIYLKQNNQINFEKKFIQHFCSCTTFSQSLKKNKEMYMC